MSEPGPFVVYIWNAAVSRWVDLAEADSKREAREVKRLALAPCRIQHKRDMPPLGDPHNPPRIWIRHPA